MYSNYGYGSSYSSSSTTGLVDYLQGAGVWVIVSIVLAIVGGFLVYFLFLNKENAKKYKGFVKWLYEFLSFKTMSLELILKILYLMTAIFITLSSFALIKASFLGFLAYLIIGNVIARIISETSLIFILMYKELKDLNKK